MLSAVGSIPGPSRRLAGPDSADPWKSETDVISTELRLAPKQNRQQKKILETAVNQLTVEYYIELSHSLALVRSLKRRLLFKSIEACSR